MPSLWFTAYFPLIIWSRYRLLAELMEQGASSTLAIPSHIPASFNTALEAFLTTSSSQATSRGSTPAIEVDGLRSLGTNPSHALLHPGFYYYLAARCTELRRERFLGALNSEVRALHHQGNIKLMNTQTSDYSASPGFANEKKVDHLVIVLEVRPRSCIAASFGS